uniref:DDE-1 domain-containing protein n=1 Tax=Trichuris muris TaxID=70415 RepID=A0A5S6QCN2_TRIMR
MVDQKGYLPEQIFNCDETSLFRRQMPKRTYIHKSEKQDPGFKPLKDRLTLVLCGDAAGHMIKPGVVYRTRRSEERTRIACRPDCDLTGLWKRFSIADFVALIAEAVHEIKPRIVSGCWKRLWRDAVSECEDIGAIDEEVMDIVNIAKELEGEGSSDMIEDDIREHIEDCGEPITNEELEQLIQSPTGSDDDVVKDT